MDTELHRRRSLLAFLGLLFMATLLVLLSLKLCGPVVDRSGYTRVLAAVRHGDNLQDVEREIGFRCTHVTAGEDQLTLECRPEGVGLCACAPVMVDLVRIEVQGGRVRNVQWFDTPGFAQPRRRTRHAE